MALVVCFLSFHYILVYLLNYEFVDVWFLSQLYLKLGPGFNSILVPPLISCEFPIDVVRDIRLKCCLAHLAPEVAILKKVDS